MKTRELAARAYSRVFARPGKAQAFNHALYHLALRGMGFNNGWQLDKSGEEWFVKNVLKPMNPRTCLDVGANRGEYSRLLLENTHAQVIAFEPLPGCSPYLDALRNEYAGRFSFVDSAVGSEPGVAELHYGAEESALASLSEEVKEIAYVGEANKNSVSVSVTTLDANSFGSGIDFLKIDTEGYEYEVLLGAQKMTESGGPKYIQIEMNLHQLFRGHTLRSFTQLLPNYESYQLLPHGMHKVDANRPEANTFCYGNFVFVCKDE